MNYLLRLERFELTRYIGLLEPLGGAQLTAAMETLGSAKDGYDVRSELRRLRVVMALESTPIGDPLEAPIPKLRRKESMAEREPRFNLGPSQPELWNVDEEEEEL